MALGDPEAPALLADLSESTKRAALRHCRELGIRRRTSPQGAVSSPFTENALWTFTCMILLIGSEL